MPGDQVLQRFDEQHVLDGFLEERIRADFQGPFLGVEMAEDQHHDRPGPGIGLQPLTDAEPVELGDQDFGDQDRRAEFLGAGERGESVGGELDRISGLLEKVPLQPLNDRITLDDQRQDLVFLRQTNAPTNSICPYALGRDAITFDDAALLKVGSPRLRTRYISPITI